jgi:hypothetical protein
MKYFGRFLFVFAGLAMAVPTVTYAHFKLLEPASWLIEGDRGDPQKAGPCGGSNADWGKPSSIVGKAVGGQKLHIKVQETIYHPGHYRVALSVASRTELPLDPVATTRGRGRYQRSSRARFRFPCSPMASSCTRPGPPDRRTPLKPTCSSPISAAGSARCRLCSSWRTTASTIPADTRITTARICRSRRIPRSRSTRAGPRTVNLGELS